MKGCLMVAAGLMLFLLLIIGGFLGFFVSTRHSSRIETVRMAAPPPMAKVKDTRESGQVEKSADQRGAMREASPESLNHSASETTTVRVVSSDSHFLKILTIPFFVILLAAAGALILFGAKSMSASRGQTAVEDERALLEMVQGMEKMTQRVGALETILLAEKK
ncbi:MAG: hypothetical protein NTX50_03055 [Candidatus Sumerlaeota bacterium]|nr:hypothetical protein [Candidatus Sumerlaeota bacterium]